MAHSKSAEKRIRVNKRNKFENRYYKTSVRTLTKKFFVVLENFKSLDNPNDLNLLLNSLYSFLDKGVKKKVFHKKFATRKKIQLSASLKKTLI